MKVWNVRLTRKRAAGAVVAAGMALMGLILFLGRPAEEMEAPCLLDTNEARVEYLGQWGWEVESEPVETLQFLLGDTLEEPYLSYNVLQRSQGFDLEDCLGKQVDRYTYTVTNYPGGREDVQVNLYVCEGEPVAGDVCCAGPDGFRNPLAYPAAPEN